MITAADSTGVATMPFSVFVNRLAPSGLTVVSWPGSETAPLGDVVVMDARRVVPVDWQRTPMPILAVIDVKDPNAFAIMGELRAQGIADVTDSPEVVSEGLRLIAEGAGFISPTAAKHLHERSRKCGMIVPRPPHPEWRPRRASLSPATTL